MATGEISDGVKQYLEQLLASHEQNLMSRFQKSEEKLLLKIGELEGKISEKDETIALMKTENGVLAKRITSVESQVAIVRAVNENLIIQKDDLEQYGRRTSIRIEGLEYEQGETGEQLK